MPEFNRRKFLIASAGVGGVGVVGGVGALILPDLLRHSQKQPALAADSGILVIITLYGGNNGISTVIPMPTMPITTPDPNWRRAWCCVSTERWA
jgi:hypothetical protein